MMFISRVSDKRMTMQQIQQTYLNQVLLTRLTIQDIASLSFSYVLQLAYLHFAKPVFLFIELECYDAIQHSEEIYSRLSLLTLKQLLSKDLYFYLLRTITVLPFSRNRNRRLSGLGPSQLLERQDREINEALFFHQTIIHPFLIYQFIISYQKIFYWLSYIHIKLSGSIFNQIFDSQLMKATQRVDSLVAIDFPETFNNLLGIVRVESQIYCFYPSCIRVYEHFSQKIMPVISEELIISQGKICLFAINKELIALVLDQTKLIVRSRKCWQNVLLNLNIGGRPNQIDLLQLEGQQLIYRETDAKSKQQIYFFIKIRLEEEEKRQEQEHLVWRTGLKIEQFKYLKNLGNIERFYMGLSKNEIKFGTYFKSDDKNPEHLSQFEFGKIKEEKNSQNKVLGFALIQNCEQKKQISYRILNLIKIVEEEEKGGNRKLKIKYRKFYEDLVESQQQSEKRKQQGLEYSEDERLDAYERMINTITQINCSQKVANQSLSQSSFEISEEKPKKEEDEERRQRKKGKFVQIYLNPKQSFNNYVQEKENIYICTSQRIILFGYKSSEGHLQELFKLESGTKLLQVCDGNIYIAKYSLHILSKEETQEKQNEQRERQKQECGQGQKQQQKYGQGQQQGQGQKYKYGQGQQQGYQQKQGQRQEQLQGQQQKQRQEQEQVSKMRSIQNQSNRIEKESQTQNLTDVLLNQIQEKQLQTMIDHLLEKRTVQDAETQTSNQEEKIQKIKQALKTSSVAVGSNLPIYPDSHQAALSKIGSNIAQIQQKIFQAAIKKVQQVIKKEEEKMRLELSKRLAEFIAYQVSNKVVPIIQAKTQLVFQTKLHQVNGYLYSLTMDNLLLLKQEIEKDQVKQNMIRSQLMKKEHSEVTEAKRAVGEMVKICNVREAQKLVYYQQLKKRFDSVHKKVEEIEEKIKILLESEELTETKIFDEIQAIKSILKTDNASLEINRKRSMNIQSEEQQSQSDSSQSEYSGKSQQIEEQEQIEQISITQSESSLGLSLMIQEKVQQQKSYFQNYSYPDPRHFTYQGYQNPQSFYSPMGGFYPQPYYLNPTFQMPLTMGFKSRQGSQRRGKRQGKKIVEQEEQVRKIRLKKLKK